MMTWLWVLALLAAGHGWGSAAAPAQPPLQVAVSARAIQPGEVVWIEVTCREPVDRVTATAFGRTIPLDASPDRRVWQFLLGIDLNVAPGEHVVRIEAAGSGRPPATATHTLRVAAKRFATRRLEVAPRYVNPPPGELARIEREAKRVQAIFDTVTPRCWEGRFRPPVEVQATPNFGSRSVFNGQPRSPHTGVDFPSPAGTPVRASNSGRVALAGDLYFSGNTVIVDHGAGVYSFFAHLSRMDVAEGDPVAAGTVVGLVGATGRVTGPHLHWAVRVNGARVDPLSLVAAVARP